MLIAQLTDIHVGFDRGNREEANVMRLRAAVARLAHGPNRPDLVLLSGDLTEFGDPESYAVLKAELAPLVCPVLAIPGNHDARAPLAAAFGITLTEDGFCHAVHELGGLRLVLLDTLEPGRHGGGFCAARAAWLSAALAAAPATPTLVVLHHPPFPAGIEWMDTDPAEPWVVRLAAALAGHAQVVGLIAGHLHRTIVTRWQGLPVFVAPSTAPPVALDLSPIDPLHPDDRVLITDEPAGYALHRWTGGTLVHHVETLANLTPLARFDPSLQGMVAGMFAERPGH